MRVGAGLLRGQFKLQIAVEPDPQAGTVTVTVRGNGLGSELNMDAGANVLDRGDGTTTLDWQGQAEVSGPLAKLGGPMIDVQARKLVASTFQRMAANISAESQRLA